MRRIRLPLYGKILSWFALNLAVLALLFFFFLKAQFKLGLDWMLSGEPGHLFPTYPAESLARATLCLS